jgi:hypothetical protein
MMSPGSCCCAAWEAADYYPRAVYLHNPRAVYLHNRTGARSDLDLPCPAVHRVPSVPSLPRRTLQIQTTQTRRGFSCFATRSAICPGFNRFTRGCFLVTHSSSSPRSSTSSAHAMSWQFMQLVGSLLANPGAFLDSIALLSCRRRCCITTPCPWLSDKHDKVFSVALLCRSCSAPSATAMIVSTSLSTAAKSPSLAGLGLIAAQHHGPA